MRQQLLCFLLGGLEDDELERVKDEITNNQQFEDSLRHIRKAVDPLDEDRQSHTPPEGLAQETCKHVADERKAEGGETGP
jgi:hypothetical protein